MSIGTTIKRLRYEHDITQEQLAEMLGITSRAISQWECDRTAPDIAQLPVLANIFKVSTDTLLGVNIQKNEEKICAVIDEARALYSAGDSQGSADLLSEALLEFPNSYRIMYELANSLLCVEGGDERAITLCERILNGNCDTELKNNSIQFLTLAYRDSGDLQTAIKYARMMPHSYCSQEDILLFLLEGKEAVLNLRSYLKFCSERVVDCLLKLSDHAEDYNTDERILLLRQAIVILTTIYSDGDYNFNAQFVAECYYKLAEIYAQFEDSENTLASLDAESEYRSIFDTYDPDALNTSPAIRGYCDGGWIPPADGNTTAQMLERLQDKKFDFIRNDSRFDVILNRLTAVACKP